MPFDATRVILRKPIKLDGENDASDYINARLVSVLEFNTSNVSLKTVILAGVSRF